MKEKKSLFIVVLVCILLFVFVSFLNNYNSNNQEIRSPFTHAENKKKNKSHSMENVQKATVSIFSQKKFDGEFYNRIDKKTLIDNDNYYLLGSGFLLSKNTILSSLHVLLPNQTEVFIRFYDKSFVSAKILRKISNDLVLLSVAETKVPWGIKPLKISKSFPEISETISSFRSNDFLVPNTLSGEILKIEKEFLYDGMKYMNVFSFSAPIDHGYSGGPILNNNAEVIAVTLGFEENETRTGMGSLLYGRGL